MSVPKRNLKGVQDIRTHSGRVDEAHQPYKAFMKIASLEMEKARRGKERESAMHRVKTIDERFKEIEAEKAAMLQALEERKNNGPSDETPGTEHKLPPRRSSGGFKIRY